MSVGLLDSLGSKGLLERAALLDKLDSQEEMGQGVNKVNGESEDLQVGTMGIISRENCGSCNFTYNSK